MLNLLRAPPGVYLVAMWVTIEGHRNKHCVMLSTLAEEHAPLPQCRNPQVNHAVTAAKKLGRGPRPEAFLRCLNEAPPRLWELEAEREQNERDN